jgi:hypothetical protein
MDSDKTDDAALEALFSAGAANPAKPADEFLARLAADADAALPEPPGPARKPSGGSLLGGLSGLFAASGLSGAAALGVWIGFVMPDLVSDVSLLGEETAGISAFLPDADLSVFSE